MLNVEKLETSRQISTGGKHVLFCTIIDILEGVIVDTDGTRYSAEIPSVIVHE